MVCRQCPGYKADVSPLLFPPASSWWLPAPPEGGAKAAGEQPSTSSDVPSGDGERHRPKVLASKKWRPRQKPTLSYEPFKLAFFFLLQLRVRHLRSTAAPPRASTSSAPAASSRCRTDVPSSAASRSLSNVSGLFFFFFSRSPLDAGVVSEGCRIFI